MTAACNTVLEMFSQRGAGPEVSVYTEMLSQMRKGQCSLVDTSAMLHLEGEGEGERERGREAPHPVPARWQVTISKAQPKGQKDSWH